jgi:3-dehydroquinate dehydratase-2
MRVLVVQGPNLRLLGARPQDAKGRTIADLNRELEAKAKALGVELKIAQSNTEGALADRLEQEKSWADAVVIEPGPLAHAGWTLRESVMSLARPAIEVITADAPKGEPSRTQSIFKDVCEGQLTGADAYLRALEALSKRGAAKTIGSRGGARAEAAGSAKKTIGRRGASEAAEVPAKTIGRERVADTGAAGALTRAVVAQKISDRLAGRLSPNDLAAWAKERWLEIQRGASVEPALEDALQRLALSTMAPSRLSDDQLLAMLSQLSV